MSILSPYSPQLARGTLLMIHSPALARRYSIMRRGIAFDTAGLLAAAVILASAGWLTAAPAALAGGIVLMGASLAMWCAGMYRLHYRIRRTPTMLFVNEEGVTGVMPDTRSLFIDWEDIRAREVRFAAIVGHAYDRRARRRSAHGLLLKGTTGKRFYLTRDLDSFDDLLDVLAEIDIPIRSTFKM